MTDEFDISGFEAYRETERGTRAVASIRSNGQLGLSNGAINRFGLSDCTVVLYFSPATKTIGIHIQPTGSTEGLKLRITRQASVSTGTISARSFLDKYGIRLDKTTRFSLDRYVLKGTPILIFDLNRPIRGVVARKARKEGIEQGDQK